MIKWKENSEITGLWNCVVETVKKCANMQRSGMPISKDGWVSMIQNLDSATQHIEHVNSLVNGLS